MQQTNSGDAHPTSMLHHLGRFTDAIFALAIALTFMGFELPNSAKSMSDADINNFLISQLEPLGNYLGTFVLVAVYWIEHTQRFAFYKKTDESHLWISILYLMSLFIVPYSNDLIISFPENSLVKVWYSLNIFLIGIFSWLSWVYATTKHRLVDSSLSTSIITANNFRALIEPVFSLLTIPVALFNQSLWEATWFLIPVIYIPVERYLEKQQQVAISYLKSDLDITHISNSNDDKSFVECTSTQALSTQSEDC